MMTEPTERQIQENLARLQMQSARARAREKVLKGKLLAARERGAVAKAATANAALASAAAAAAAAAGKAASSSSGNATARAALVAAGAALADAAAAVTRSAGLGVTDTVSAPRAKFRKLLTHGWRPTINLADEPDIIEIDLCTQAPEDTQYDLQAETNQRAERARQARSWRVAHRSATPPTG